MFRGRGYCGIKRQGIMVWCAVKVKSHCGCGCVVWYRRLNVTWCGIMWCRGLEIAVLWQWCGVARGQLVCVVWCSVEVKWCGFAVWWRLPGVSVVVAPYFTLSLTGGHCCLTVNDSS